MNGYTALEGAIGFLVIASLMCAVFWGLVLYVRLQRRAERRHREVLARIDAAGLTPNAVRAPDAAVPNPAADAQARSAIFDHLLELHQLSVDDQRLYEQLTRPGPHRP